MLFKFSNPLARILYYITRAEVIWWALSASLWRGAFSVRLRDDYVSMEINRFCRFVIFLWPESDFILLFFFCSFLCIDFFTFRINKIIHCILCVCRTKQMYRPLEYSQPKSVLLPSQHRVFINRNVFLYVWMLSIDWLRYIITVIVIIMARSWLLITIKCQD